MQRRDDEGDDNTNLFDGRQIADYILFVKGSLRRHRWMAAGIFTAIVGLVAFALAALPKTYHVEAKLLAQRSQVLVVRGDGPDAGVAPTRGAVETIRGREALLAIIATTDLIRHTDANRSLSQRAVRAVIRLIPHKQETEQDRVDGMVEQLEKKLTAWVTDGTVSIAVEWQDADMARRIVDAAQKHFLAVRRAQEVDALAESISIVASHGASLAADIDVEVAALESLRAERQTAKADTAPTTQKAPGASASQPAAKAAPRRAEPRPEQQGLKAAIATKLHAIDELEGTRRQKLTEAQGRLAEQRGVYTDNHPTIVDLKQTVASLSVPSPQVVQLRADLASLQSDFDKPAEARGDVPASAVSPGPYSGGGSAVAIITPPALSSDILRLDTDLREDRDPAIVYARARLRDAMDKYALLRAQVQATQIDLETAQAAFKYRYTVVTPAQLPRTPVKPNVPLVMIAAIIAAAFAALLLAVWVDVRSGRLIERWQIERLLDRPILGEMVPRLASATKR